MFVGVDANIYIYIYVGNLSSGRPFFLTLTGVHFLLLDASTTYDLYIWV